MKLKVRRKLLTRLRDFLVKKSIETKNYDFRINFKDFKALVKYPDFENFPEKDTVLEVVNRLKQHRSNRIKKRSQRNLPVNDFYASYEWRRLKYSILVKYGRKCMCCGTEKGVMNVDHIKPLRKNWKLRLDPENLQVLCAQCNHGKGNWDETDFRSEGKPDEDDFIKNYVKKYVLKEDSIDKDTQYRLGLIKDQLRC